MFDQARLETREVIAWDIIHRNGEGPSVEGLVVVGREVVSVWAAGAFVGYVSRGQSLENLRPIAARMLAEFDGRTIH